MSRPYTKRTKEEQLVRLKDQKESWIEKISRIQSKIEKLADKEQRLQNKLGRQKVQAGV